MRSSACWIATLWHDTYAVWDSSAFRDCFISFFLDRCRLLFVWLVFPLTGPRVLGITVVLYSEIATLWHDTHSVWFSFLFWAPLIISWKLYRFSFIWQIVFFPVSVFFVLHWYISSRSLVGHRWCLRWCSVYFVWLQRDMRSSACWIATLWLDSHSVWDSSAFRARFISVMVLCHSRSLTCLCSYRFPCSWYHSGVFVRNPWLVNVDVWRHVRLFSFGCSFTCAHLPAGSQHCGMIPIQCDFRSIFELI